MPQLGETVTEGTITKWFKAVGDQVARDEPLFEVSTDKVDSEVPSPAEGVLTAILVEEGDTVDVGVTLAVIGDGGLGQRHGPTPRPPVRCRTRSRNPRPACRPAPLRRPAPTPPPGRRARSRPRPSPPTGFRRPSTPATPRRPPHPNARRPPPPWPRGTGLVLSPVVRKLLSENGIDRSDVDRHGTRRAHHPGAMWRQPSPRDRARRRPNRRETRRRCRASHGSPPAGGGGAGSGRGPGPGRVEGRDRPLHQHPAPHRRAHGPLQGDLRPHPDGQGDRLRAGRAGPADPRRAVPSRGGVRPHLPALRRPGRRSRPWPSSPISTRRSATTR